jgi:hypothetical protein
MNTRDLETKFQNEIISGHFKEEKNLLNLG